MAKTSLEYKLEISKAKRVLGVPSDVPLESLSKEDLCQHFIDCIKAKQLEKQNKKNKIMKKEEAEIHEAYQNLSRAIERRKLKI